MSKNCLVLLGIMVFFYSCKPAEQAPADTVGTTATETMTTAAATETATAADTSAAPPYPQIVEQANQIFQQSLPGAITFVATGSPQSGVATSPSQLNTWVFIARKNNDFRRLVFENGQFGQPMQIGLWVGVANIPLPQGSLSLQQAIDILNQKGFTQGFTSVSMGTPVVQNPQPMYWFCVDGQTQGISASTGEYFPNLFPCGGHAEIQLPTKP